MGYGYIAAPHAEAIQTFYEQYFNPYLNFHRPCAVAECVVDRRGKQKKKYRWYATPWEILRQLPDLAGQLQPGVTVLDLDQRARAQTDLQMPMPSGSYLPDSTASGAHEGRTAEMPGHHRPD